MSAASFRKFRATLSDGNKFTCLGTIDGDVIHRFRVTFPVYMSDQTDVIIVRQLQVFTIH